VLGEVMLAVTIAVQAALATDPEPGEEFHPAQLAAAVGGLLLVFGLWWSYFKHSASDRIRRLSLRRAIVWGYGHYLVFAAVAALGAGLLVVVDTLGGTSHVTPTFAAFTVAIPVAVFLAVYGLLNTGMSRQTPVATRLVLITAGLVLLTGLVAPVIGLPLTVLVMALLVALLLAYHLAAEHAASG
jgi:low temperature requirement A protein (LtrA)